MNKEVRNKFGVDQDKPVDWFESLYSGTSESGEGVPWANMAPHPIFKKWIETPHNGSGKTALVVGCGLGDDAIELESKGYQVTAFDISQSAIELCKRRFPDSQVKFVQADLLKGISEWYRKFDFVLEIFTIQALPPKYESVLIENIANFVAQDGKLVMITEIKEEKRSFENGPPWLLNSSYIPAFENHDLKKVYFTNTEKPEMGDEVHLTIFQRII